MRIQIYNQVLEVGSLEVLWKHFGMVGYVMQERIIHL